MKKFIMCFVGAMLVLSLAACTPTPVKQSESATEPMVEASTGGASDKVPDPNVEPMEIISVYSSNEDATGLNQAMDAVDELTAQSLVDKLIEYGVLEEGTEVLNFDTKDGIGTLDLSKVPSSGTSGELLMLTALGIIPADTLSMAIMITWNITEIIKSCKEACNNYYHI